MEKPDAQRRLAAILCADVVGYSRLMQADDAGTLRALTECRALFDNRVGEYRGRIVNAPGDSILAEFASVIDALRCAVEIQGEVEEHNAGLPEETRMQFRIGVNLGDVLFDDAGIYGDGVNIAARLESLADPGGICISGTVHSQVENKIGLPFQYLGKKEVKNIVQPIPVYKVLREDQEPEKISLQPPPTPPDKPSIAVLAFDNMSGDPEQEYFSDGISEDIITDLSKISGLLVIARNSSFSYKGKSTDLRQVGQELGVRYILEGSVRRGGNKVRITAQLIEAKAGHHLWAERFDRNMDDLFAVQDEITEEIVTALNVTLVAGEQARMWRKALQNPKARDLFYRSRALIHQGTRETLIQAEEGFLQVIEMEPASPLGYVWAAWALWWKVFRGWSDDPGGDIATIPERAGKVLEIDPNNGEGHAVFGICMVLCGDFEESIEHARQAVKLAPNNADVLFITSFIQVMYGNTETAIDLGQRAVRLSPVSPPLYLNILGVAYREGGLFEEAISVLSQAVAQAPEFITARYALLTAYAAAGMHEESRATAGDIARTDPLFNLVEYTHRLPFREMAVKERILENLKKAGVI